MTPFSTDQISFSSNFGCSDLGNSLETFDPNPTNPGGKKPKVAITACMPKLLTILNAMLKYCTA
jgi:hypothetical protein